jgi:hypothetical protein
MSTMPNANLLAWIAALESGEFQHATGALCRPINYNPDGTATLGYCCLGVATELFRRATGRGEWLWENLSDDTHMVFVIDGKENAVNLEPEVAAWLGLAEVFETQGAALNPMREIDIYGYVAPNDHSKQAIARVNDRSTEGFKPVIAELRRRFLGESTPAQETDA